MNNPFSRLTAPLALGLPLLAFAQQPDPADAKMPDAALRYQSAFSDYKPWQDIKPGNWRQLNDDLLRQTGPGVHAHHGLSETTSAPGSLTTRSPSPAGHQDRPVHGGKP
ncbi:hypothetical protein [Variovorax sp. OV329]|uniref:hypothetical protein n=1 Tax=Variovorax sp. OV329 TaxID=1882825 RepID=UPI0008EBB756|nr:hypothetical protein [Variovorax sp. OV329]SFN29128.1 hypothetical protein SAMN05444747_120100 [Variovorax sp. OV329]